MDEMSIHVYGPLGILFKVRDVVVELTAEEAEGLAQEMYNAAFEVRTCEDEFQEYERNRR